MPEEKNAHNWQITEQYAHATLYKCSVCLKGRCYSWMPGWPGSYEYYTKEGDRISVAPYAEPPCTTFPEAGLFSNLNSAPQETK